MRKSEVRDPEKAARNKKLIFAAVAVLLVLVLALFEWLVPLKTLLPAAALPARKDGEMRVHFLDVGQGDCTVLEFPDGDLLVVDAGDGSFENNVNVIRYLKGLNASGVSVVATHADSDHYGGLRELISAFGAETVYLPAAAAETQEYRSFLAAAEATGCELVTLSRYGVIARPSGAYAVCLSPHAVGETDENESSAVLYVSYAGVNLLLGGDIGAAREELLLREYALFEGIFDSGAYRVRLEDTDILKVSHHGSAYSSSEAWLATLSPQAAVVSCGRGNTYSHPAAESIARLTEAGAKVYRTDELGNVVLCISEGKFTVYTDLE